MPPEDELNDPEGLAAKHPETADNPESVLPATERSKRQILGCVEAEAKAGKQREEDGSWHASKISSDGQTSIRIHFWPVPDEDGHTATVVATTEYNEKDGTGIDTVYRILEVPDGLHIERGIRDHIDLRESRPNPLKTHEEILAAAEESSAGMDRRLEAVQAEQELGLRFFSLKDAKDLLALLEGSKPQS